MSKVLNDLLKILTERKEQFSKSQTEIYNKSKKPEHKHDWSLMHRQVDVLRIRMEEIDDLIEIVKSGLNKEQTVLVEA